MSNIYEEVKNSRWLVKKSAVYLYIETEGGYLIAFKGVSEKDFDIANYICELHNNMIDEKAT